MPKRPSANVVVLYLEVNPELKARLQARAERCRRPLKAECILGLKLHLTTEPRVEPPPEPKPLPDKPKRPHGRPKEGDPT